MSQRRHSGLVLLILPSLLVLVASVPISFLNQIPLCVFKFGSGLDCPGCGLTRAFHYLFEGEFQKSILMNGMAPLILLFFILYWVQHGYFFFSKPKIKMVFPPGQSSHAALFFGFVRTAMVLQIVAAAHGLGPALSRLVCLTPHLMAC